MSQCQPHPGSATSRPLPFRGCSAQAGPRSCNAPALAQASSGLLPAQACPPHPVCGAACRTTQPTSVFPSFIGF